MIFPDYSKTSAFTYTEGVVYLTFYDSKTRKPSWTGSVVDSNYGADFNEPQVQTAVNELTDAFKKSA